MKSDGLRLEETQVQEALRLFKLAAIALAEHGRDRDRRAPRPMPRPPDWHAPALESEILAWERQRNAARARIKWMFTIDKARTKMGRAYPCHADIRRPKLKES
jgi:hypothetical protein